MTLSDLRVGEACAVLNGQQSSTFAARVTAILGEDIHVFVPEKNANHVYSRHDGRARLNSNATLTTVDDWRVRVLIARRTFHDLHRYTVAATKRFHQDPTPGNAAALQSAVHEWREYVLTHPDPLALRVDSIEEYQRLSPIS